VSPTDSAIHKGNPAGFQTPHAALVKMALLGTERGMGALPALDGPLGAIIGQLDTHDAERALLSAGVAIALYRRAGRVPDRTPAPLPEPSALEELPRCSALAGHHLSVMLSDQHDDVLPEWLGALIAAGQRVPEESLVALLDLGRRQPSLQELILPAIGRRGHWLAAQNPAWDYGRGGDDESLWQTGGRAARVAALTRVRRRDPAGARALLAAAWASEPADSRAAFLATLQTGLSLADEPFLEAALDDRSKDVRQTAADLLARLPESQLCARMIARVRPLLRFVAPGLRALAGKKPKIEVTLPAECDKAMLRDGVEKRPQAGTGEKAAWLRQMIGMVPPRTWCDAWNTTPAVLIGAVPKEWKLLLEGWAEAATRQQDTVWAQAFLFAPRGPQNAVDREEMLTILPPDQREAIVRDLLRSDPDALYGNDSILPLLWQCPAPWSVELSRLVLDGVRRRMASSGSGRDWSLHSAMEQFGRYLPTELLAEATTGWPESAPKWADWRGEVTELLALLQFRREMHEVLSQKS